MVFGIVSFVLLPLVVVVALTVLSGRRRRVRDGDYDGDSAGFVGGVLCALFTVVLAFFVVFAWQTGDDLDSTAQTESDAVIDTYWQSALVPKEDGDRIRGLVQRYALDVADKEWPALADGREDPAAGATLTELRAAVAALPVDAAVAAEARKQSMDDVRAIDENHRARVDMATDTDVFTIVLLVGSVVGGAMMVVFPLVFGLSTRPANVVLMALLVMSVSATLYVSWQLMHPLDGLFGADPDAFRAAVEEMSAPVNG